MSEETSFTIELEPELRDAFLAEADAAAQPASQILRDMMRDFIKQQAEARSYTEFLRRKVEIARAQVARGEIFSQEEVEAEVAARRAKFLSMAEESEA